jgi:hypothetical protein
MKSLYGLLKLVDKKIREQKSPNAPASVST